MSRKGNRNSGCRDRRRSDRRLRKASIPALVGAETVRRGAAARRGGRQGQSRGSSWRHRLPDAERLLRSGNSLAARTLPGRLVGLRALQDEDPFVPFLPVLLVPSEASGARRARRRRSGRVRHGSESGTKLRQRRVKSTTSPDQLTLGKGRGHSHLPPKHLHLRFCKQAQESP